MRDDIAEKLADKSEAGLLAIKTALRDVYGGIDGIADEVAVSVNNTVYVVDSGREKGTITCRVVEKILIEDNETREEFVRMVNHDALSKGSISDGLSKSPQCLTA